MVARHHWLTGATMLVFVAIIYVFTRNSTWLELSRKGYTITLSPALGYGATGTLVWFGVPGGRQLNYLFALLYFARPQLGLRLRQAMAKPEFKAYFKRDKPL